VGSLSPWGKVTTPAYNDGKKWCLSAKGGSGNPRKKVYQQNKALTRAFRKGGRRLSEDEIRVGAHKRQKEIRDAAHAAEMIEEEVALEKPKDLAEKESARRAATGHAGKNKNAAEEFVRKASTGQAGKVKRAAEEAKRWAATGQADNDKHAGVEPRARLQRGKTERTHAQQEMPSVGPKRRLKRLRRSRKRPQRSANRGRRNATFTRIPPARCQDPRDARRGLVRRGGSQAK
jgi:hypothetical protein